MRHCRPVKDECPICSHETAAPPSTWTLFRLARFARPYKWQLLSGFLLTLASTGATLVPPYLTMPLMDNVLIPFQNGQPIDWELVSFYLERPARCRHRRLGTGLDSHLYSVAGFGTHRSRPAHHHLRTSDGPVAGIFRRQAHR
jgi:hypothetical protein